MNWLKRNPLLGSVLVLGVALLAAEGWLWSRGCEQARRALAVLELKQQERDQLARQSLALSERNEQAVARDLANTKEVLAALRSALQGRDATILAAAPPAKSLDLYFDIAAFVEKARTLATRAQVTARPDERFGFASCASAGPETDLVPVVFRQRVIGQYLVEALLESRPRALLAVQRERPLTAAQRSQSAPSGTAWGSHHDEPADYFDFDGQMSLRAPGRLDSDAFRLEFTGQTAALRAFLNTLATFKLPLIVRSVEVEPVAAEASPINPAAPPPAAGTPLPMVTQNLSKFTVVVECVQPAATPEGTIL